MLQVTIKIELNALDKAKTELLALLGTVDELAKTYKTTFNSIVTDTVEEPTPKVEEPTPKVEEPKKAPVKKKAPKKVEEPVDDKSEPITLAVVTSIAKAAVKTHGRDQVKDIISKFSEDGKISGTPEDKLEALNDALLAM